MASGSNELRHVLLVLAAVAAIFAFACSSSSKTIQTSTPLATITVGSEATATPADLGVVAQLVPALLQPADVSADWHVVQNQNKVLAQRDVPGLSSAAKGSFTILASPDKNEYINQLIVVPDDRNAVALLDAFTVDNYLGGLASGANDATASLTTLPGSPPGAKALTFSGTTNAGASPQPINGEAIAFVHGPVFVIIIHGTYQPPKYSVDAAALATTVNARLASVPGAN